jgi:hypothetical protein
MQGTTLQKGRIHFLRSMIFLSCLIWQLSPLGVKLSAATNAAVTPATVSNNELPPGWIEIKPGGETKCARGGEFSFFFFQGEDHLDQTSEENVIVDFMGGGACWNEETCAPGSSIFWDTVDLLRERIKTGLEGLYNHFDPRNPFKKWSHLVIPYCSADIHWGDSVKTYGTGPKSFTIYHKGAANSKAALKWLKEYYQQKRTKSLKSLTTTLNEKPNQPDNVLVTGCSAGSYGSIYWTPRVVEDYPGAQVVQLGDSGSGVITRDFVKTSFPYWRSEQNAATWIPELDPKNVDWSSLSMNDIYKAIGNHYPETRLSQFNTAYDEVQVFFYELMGGGGEKEWSQKMNENVQKLSTELDNFNYFTGGGTQHCVLPYESFYRMKTQGKAFYQWFYDFVRGEEVGNTHCVGMECDPLID